MKHTSADERLIASGWEFSRRFGWYRHKTGARVEHRPLPGHGSEWVATRTYGKIRGFRHLADAVLWATTDKRMARCR